MTLGRTKLVIAYLSEHGHFPGKSRAQINEALGWHPATEVTARIREARTPAYGAFDIRVEQFSKKEFTYWMPPKERERAKQLVAHWIEQSKKGRAA
ncbi:MAG TPA: hypothetical protein VNL91_09125 [Thermoanaerobaculia bacterium]|nr:hypothetical protein [Thermoanaerobaculia bacterium]